MSYKIQLEHIETIENGERSFHLNCSDTMFVEAPLLDSQEKYLKKFLKKQGVTATLIYFDKSQTKNAFCLKGEVNSTVTKIYWNDSQNRFSVSGRVMKIEDAIVDINTELQHVPEKPKSIEPEQKQLIEEKTELEPAEL